MLIPIALAIFFRQPVNRFTCWPIWTSSISSIVIRSGFGSGVSVFRVSVGVAWAVLASVASTSERVSPAFVLSAIALIAWRASSLASTLICFIPSASFLSRCFCTRNAPALDLVRMNALTFTSPPAASASSVRTLSGLVGLSVTSSM